MLVVAALGLLAGAAACTPVPRAPTDRRFEQAWQAAHPWPQLAGVLARAYPGSGAGTGQLLLSAMLWPDKLDLHPQLVPHPAWQEQLRQGHQQEVQAAMQQWRATNLCSGTWSLVVPVTASADGDMELAVDLPPGRYQFLALSTGDHDWVRLSQARDKLQLTPGLEPWTTGQVRLVVALQAQPRPVQVYRHGDEITVASWGVGLRLVALQWRQERGFRQRQWFAPAA